jgi:hypothetical protein
MSFRFTCKTCGEVHEGIPTFGADAPLLYSLLSPETRDDRAVLGSDNCIIDNERFLIRGCLEIPVHGETDPFAWGVWVDVSEADHTKFDTAFGQDMRSEVGPFAGYLGNALPTYPDTMNLVVVAHLRDHGIRPSVEVSPTSHPLYIEQRDGISQQRLAEIYQEVMHAK